MNRWQKHGFTLVELLVVITIIGILIAMLLPAVQAAREAARRMQCQNNIKQIGLAVLNYESQYKIFPPSSSWGTTSINSSSQYAYYGANWAIMILPFLDLQSLYDKFEFNKPISGSTSQGNMTARATPIPTMLCPSDPYNRKAFNGADNPTTLAFGSNWARGNYAANGALGQMDSGTDNFSSYYNAAMPDSPGWKTPCIRGIMGANTALKMADIIDGTSNTVMLGEVRAGMVTIDSRGVWALGGGSSALWGYSSIAGDDYGPNNPTWNSDDIIAGSSIISLCGGSDTLVAEGMPCFDNVSNDQVTSRSLHPDGVNMCFADGSVHWISDYIQAKGSSISIDSTTNAVRSWNFSVWDRLMSSGDGQVIKGNAY